LSVPILSAVTLVTLADRQAFYPSESGRGGPPAITDALGGQIDGVIGTVLLLIDFIRSGKLRALAVTGLARSELLPNVPTVSTIVPDFEASQWIGIGAPAKTPAAIIERLNGEANATLADPRIKTRLIELGGTFRVRRLNLASSSQRKPRSGGRW
jgi:tripartite-type tricarboxylate transporter receptor subunit TctC